MDPASVDQTWTYSNICQVGFQQRGGGGGDGEEGVGKLSPRRRTESQVRMKFLVIPTFFQEFTCDAV